MTPEAAARSAATGGVSGGLATLAMSGVMLAAGRLGLMGEYPPERIARGSLRASGWGPISAEAMDGPLGATLHVAFGAVLGTGFAVAAGAALRRVRASEAARRAALPVAGVAFGSLVWLVSYWGWIPGLGLLPPPDRDRPGRQVSMLVAHWAYGATLGLLLDAALVSGALDPADGADPGDRRPSRTGA